MTQLVKKLVDRIDRRVLQGEVIPPSEKTDSVFVPFTRWCSKGKPVELGMPVCVLEDEHRFVLICRIMWSESDVDLIPEIIEDAQEKSPRLQGCSLDKGFQSPPRKVRLSNAGEEREGAKEFREARRKHPAAESVISNTEQPGPDRIRERSEEGFARMAGAVDPGGERASGRSDRARPGAAEEAAARGCHIAARRGAGSRKNERELVPQGAVWE